MIHFVLLLNRANSFTLLAFVSLDNDTTKGMMTSKTA